MENFSGFFYPICGILFFLLLIYLYVLYVNIIKNSNHAREALSGIDVRLKKRHDLIPNILTIAEKFMGHEKSLMEEITNLRSKTQNARSGSEEKFQYEEEMKSKLNQLMAQLENYPQLKSDGPMIQAMQAYNEIEEQIADSRRLYNTALTKLKNSTMIFPGNLFAGFAGETDGFAYFSTDTDSEMPVDAQNFLK